jgi:hypothetical protein
MTDDVKVFRAMPSQAPKIRGGIRETLGHFLSGQCYLFRNSADWCSWPAARDK